MKKSLIYTLASTALVLSAATTAFVSSFATTEQKSESLALNSSTDLAKNTNSDSFSTSETVYIITNPDGSFNKTFVNNTINTSSEPLPLESAITYNLDGNEIKAEDLVGKSGHVKITFKFTATKTYQNKLVPFLTVTGVTLDNNKFKNVKIDNGKTISENSDTTILAGYTLTGLNEDLNTDFLPNSFTITADVTNFELKNTYTFVTNELFAEIDTAKLSSVDNLVNSINELDQAFNQILTGSNDLANGLDQTLAGSKKLQAGAHDLTSGANQLNSGAHDLANGTKELSAGITTLDSGLSQLSANSDELNLSAAKIFNALLNSTAEKIGQPLTPDTYDEILTNLINQLAPIDPETATELGKTKALLDGYKAFLTGLAKYTGTVDYIASQTPNLQTGANRLLDGTNTLAAGTTSLASGANELANGTTELTTGLEQLTNGGHTLSNGLSTFKQQGLNKLIDFANNDLSTFTANLRSTVNAAKSCHYYSNPNVKSVKFIFKTPSLK